MIAPVGINPDASLQLAKVFGVDAAVDAFVCGIPAAFEIRTCPEAQGAGDDQYNFCFYHVLIPLADADNFDTAILRHASRRAVRCRR